MFLGSKLLNNFKLGQKLTCNHADHGINRNSQNHTRNSGNASCHKNHEEYLKGMGFDTVRIDNGLEDHAVDQSARAGAPA